MIMKDKIYSLLPSGYYIIWWTATLLTFLWFDISWCMFTSFRPFTGYMSIYVVLLAAATLFSMPAALSRRGWIQAVLLIILDMLFVANLMYARTYMVPIPLESYAIAGNLAGFGSSVIESLRWSDLLFPAITAAAAVMSLYAQRHHARTAKHLWVYLAVLVLTLGASYVTIAGRGGFKERFSSMARSVNDQQSAAPVYTIFCTMAYDWLTLDEPLSPEVEAETKKWFTGHKKMTDRYALSVARDTLDSPLRNVVILLCESLESWPIGLTLEGKEITPFLNSVIADTSVYYCPNVLTQVKDGRSIDGQLLYLAGQLPLASGVYSMKYASGEYKGLPRAMKENGAHTYLLSADRRMTWNQAPVAAAMGIDSLLMSDFWAPDAPVGSYITDGELFDRSIGMMDSGRLWPEGQYAFLMWVTHTGHNPFVPPAGLDTLSLDGDYPALLSDYISTTHYVDEALKHIVEYIMSRDDAGRTVVAVVGDHEGLASSRKDFADAYPWVSDRPLTPLILINSPYSGHDDKVIGQVDVYSALLDAAGLYGGYEWRGMGLSPFDSSHPRCAVGSTGQLVSNGDSVAPAVERHLRDSYPAADVKMRYQLDF